MAHLKGKKSHHIIQRGLETLVNMTHRGAEGADSKTGDGAGVMIQIPRDFYLMQGYCIVITSYSIHYTKLYDVD